ncbi:hypothetical protein [Acinetobacter johnsonii]|uniref:Uncharacterized protein n=1 Tax=Acinetobacter johnsonii TaxID=40214 RepID=A0A427V4K3_ACIJO|nr:hypothetical protein [Acinetobacter johnsonii]RSE27623.1 hypothetical protein EGT73_01010 [Acinetobacter johnsonii]
MSRKEPKKIGLKRTVWLFEREVLEKFENTNLDDHHKVLEFNLFSTEYEIKPKFNNGRADAITMRNAANHWFKIWFAAYAACTADMNRAK